MNSATSNLVILTAEINGDKLTGTANEQEHIKPQLGSSQFSCCEWSRSCAWT